MIVVANNLRELLNSIVSLTTYCNAKGYPNEFKTYDEAWEELRLSLDHLRSKLGEARHAQLIDMATQAKAHFDAEGQDEQQGLLGSWLMQDVEQVVKGKSPFAYPEELFRWTRQFR